MKEKSGASRTESEEVLRLLKNARPDQVEATELSDGSFEIHFIPGKPMLTRKRGNGRRWRRNLPKRIFFGTDLGDELRKHARRFRETFVLK